MRHAPLILLALALLAPAARAQWTEAPHGRSLVARLRAAPFPHPSRPQFTDNRTLIFVPRGFAPGPTVDIVVHYHGHRAETVESATFRRLREQLAGAQVSAVLLCPQGPLRAADSAGGKHEEPGGLARFLAEALERLVADGVVPQGARVGRVVLSGHSGAYRVIARALGVGGVDVSEVYLHDGLYAESDAFFRFATTPGKRFLSTSTPGGGTAANNEALRTRLRSAGLSVASTEDDATLRSTRTMILATGEVHDAVTHTRDRLQRFLATSGLTKGGAPRPTLLAVRRDGGQVEVGWRAAAVGHRGWRVKAFDPGAGVDGTPGATLVEVGPDARSARVPAGSLVAVTVVCVGPDGGEGPPSHAYACSSAGTKPAVLVVDGFRRRSGRYTKETHPFAATLVRAVAAAGYPVDSARAEVVGREVDVRGYACLVWLAGDQSVDDQALDARERSVVNGQLLEGRAALVSGSEVAFDLGRGPQDERSFLANALGATFAADAAAGGRASGAGPLAGVSATFSAGPYAVAFPDVFGLTGQGAVKALAYADGRTAAVGVERGGRGRSLLVGFPLECVTEKDALVARSLEWLLAPPPPTTGITAAVSPGP